MTLEEFGRELARINHRVTHFYEYDKPLSDKRKDARNTRSYVNAKRGNFHGKKQKVALSQLQKLNNLVQE